MSHQGSSKGSKKSPADDLTCPITLELLFDPVTAEDGRVYERAAILSHFERHPTGLIKSPMTNLKMGRRLLPAVQTKNLIETLIETGAIKGDLANNWTERKNAADIKKRAEGGDADAMYTVGRFFLDDNNSKLAYQWFKRAADAENVKGMAMAGSFLILGTGVDNNRVHGMTLIAIAAERGSDFACYLLGMSFACGAYGSPIDTSQGARWLRKALSDACSHHHLAQDTIATARSKLQELGGETASETSG